MRFVQFIAGLFGYRLVRVQTFKASGAYTPPAGMVCCNTVEVSGGGDGGYSGPLSGAGGGSFSSIEIARGGSGGRAGA